MSEVPLLVEDQTFYPRLVRLAGCLCEELAAAGLETCFCGVVVGDSIDMSRIFEDNSGMGWVRLAGALPSASQAGIVNPCVAQFQATIEVGYAECIAIPDEGESMSLEDELEGARRLMAGMAATRRAAMCCDWGASKKALSPASWAPGGPEGGVIWGTWQFTLEVP